MVGDAGIPAFLCGGYHILLFHLVHFHQQKGDRACHALVCDSDRSVPYRIHMAGIQLPSGMEYAFIHIPFHIRMSWLHEPLQCRHFGCHSSGDAYTYDPDGHLFYTGFSCRSYGEQTQ